MQVRHVITRAIVVAGLAGIAALVAAAHPGSGIVVGDSGRVYFVHAEVGVWTASPDGELTQLGKPAWHFMIQDPGARFAEERWPRFNDGEVRETGSAPALIRASSFPLAIGSDGALYYPQPNEDGNVHILRLEPGGKPSDYVALPPIIEIGYEGDEIQAQWIHGLAAAKDGSLYYTEQNAIKRIDPERKVSVVAAAPHIPDCEHPPTFSDGRDAAFLRGLDVTDDGTVYAAASACSAVLKVTPDGTVSVALRAEQPWSPTGIAIKNGDIYVLENQYIEADRAGEWLPRVRKLAPDGSVTTIATVTERVE